MLLGMQKDIDFSPVYGYNKQANQYASVAQSVVHLTRNEKVACSSQVTSSIILYFGFTTEQKSPCVYKDFFSC